MSSRGRASSRPKAFIVDSMLGHLAKWLRILGYDTLYSSSYADWQILRIAEKTGRTIVTGDRGLYWRARKRGLNAILIEEQEKVARLAELAAKARIKLELDPRRSRCPVCNGELVEVRDKRVVADRVPPQSLEANSVFYVCTKCGKVYWEGSHWRNMRRVVEEAKRLLGEDRGGT